MRRRAGILAGLLLTLCCVAAAVGSLAYLLWPQEEARPVVLINSPSYGEEVQVGETVTVQAVARDQGEVTRVELWVDGQLQETQSSTLPGGISPFPMVTQWQAVYPGTHRLTARAFNAQGARAHASINLEVLAEADQDGDGVTDQQDLCLDEVGWRASNGCPDRDHDGIPDAEDACPDEAGLPDENGCPAPSEHDGDGDGVLDDVDACPTEAGAPVAEGCPDADGDRVADAEDACPTEAGWHENDGCPAPGDLDFDGIPDVDDACPEEWGLPEHSGCSDDDGDGVPDRADACLDELGLPEHAGCADRDGDGVPDRDDLRPDEPGLPQGHGAPDTGAPDSDGDGVPDDIDECDHEEGLPEHVGCPPPGMAEDADGDGIADDERLPGVPLGGLFFRALRRLQPGPGEQVPLVLTRLQVEFRTFAVSGDYDEILCYMYDYSRYNPGTGHLPVDDHGPYALEGRSWNIAEVLGGRSSFFPDWDTDDALPVLVDCEAYIGTEMFDLGEVRLSHPETEWTGEDITPPSSSGGDEGHWFDVTYRICNFWCEFMELERPNIIAYVIGGNLGVAWEWEGDEGMITGFALYVDGVRQGTAPPDARVAYIDFEPACERSYDLDMTAYRDDPGGQESPPSNTADLEGIECPRRVRVEFYSLETGYLGALGEDERFRRDYGPINGHFRANSGDTEQRLDFDAVNPGSWWGEPTTGFRLRNGREYLISDFFDWIWRRMNCMGECPDYSVPGHNYITVELGPSDDLTFGGTIFDHDDDNASDVLFDADYTIEAEDIEEVIGEMVRGECVRLVEDREMTLQVRLSVIAE